MKVLLACEESQAVTIEFRRLGHEAYSCDLEPCSGGHPEWHIHGDVIPVLKENWDMIIAFPPCTYLCSSGMHWTTRGLRDPQLTEDALAFVENILNNQCDKIALENSVGVISSRIRRPDQIIQPWMFGDNASKKTCLWLKGLPRLTATDIILPEGWQRVRYADEMDECPDCGEPYCDVIIKRVDGFEFGNRTGLKKPVWGNQTPSGQNKLGPSPERAKLRSKTYHGIAKAMAEQWGKI